MYDLNAHAVRYGSSIEITITGFLPTSCHQAKISDIYPGGNIIYIKDPGSAQVFIQEIVQPGTILCAMVLIPWANTTTIIDEDHDTVSIFVNKQKELEVKVTDKNKDQFIVIQLTGGIIPNGPYSIVPADSYYPAIYTKVYGPNSYKNCDAYISNQSGLAFEILDGIALGYGGKTPKRKSDKEHGGGGGAPHGLRVLSEESGGSGNPRGL